MSKEVRQLRVWYYALDGTGVVEEAKDLVPSDEVDDLAYEIMAIGLRINQPDGSFVVIPPPRIAEVSVSGKAVLSEEEAASVAGDNIIPFPSRRSGRGKTTN